MKKFLYIIVALFLISCSDEDPSEGLESESFEYGGVVYTSQLVRLENSSILEEEYDADLGGRNIKILQIADNELIFKVPFDIEDGEHILSIPTLGNFKIKYNIKQTKLVQPAEEILSEIFGDIDNYISNIPDSSGSNYLSTFKNKFDEFYNNSSQEEKIEMASFYQTNKNLFDDLLLSEYTSRQSFNGSNLELLVKYSAAVLGFGVSAAIAIIDPEPTTKALATLVAVIAWNKALNYKTEFARRNVKIVNVIIDNIAAELESRQSVEAIEIISGENVTLPLKSSRRAIIKSDKNDENDNIQNYFGKHERFNSVIENLNIAIEFLNENIYFSDIDLIPLSVINSDNPLENSVGNQDFFNSINFSIDDENINLSDMSFVEDRISFIATIIDTTDIETSVQTFMNFSYEDDFNRLVGSFPIEVFLENPEVDIKMPGKWEIDYVVSCSTTYGSESSWSEVGGYNYKKAYIFENNGIVYDPSSLNDRLRGTYIFDGNELVFELNYTVEKGLGWSSFVDGVPCEDGTGSVTMTFQGSLVDSRFIGEIIETRVSTYPSCTEYNFTRKCSGIVTISPE